MKRINLAAPSKFNLQRGTAGMGILAAMMVVGVITALAVKYSWRSDLDLARAGHRWMGMQAKAYIEGAERLAVIALKKDKQDTTIDSLDEAWATGFDFPTDHGLMQVTINDAQGRINVNALGAEFISQNGQQLSGVAKYSVEQKRFIRFLQTIEIEEDEYISTAEAEAILEAVKDWVDADSQATGYGGAEADYYSQLDYVITPSDGPMISVSELMLIKGMTPALYQGLLPFVSALDASAELNVLTMSTTIARVINQPDQLVPLSFDDAELLIDDIATGEIESVDDFIALPVIDTLVGKNSRGAVNLDRKGLGIASSFFELDTTITVGEHVRRGRSLIERDSTGTRVIRRSDSKF